MKIGKFSVWFGKTPIYHWVPWPSYFDGGFYKKIGILWLNFLVEFSYSTDTLNYNCKRITKQEAEKLINGD